MKRTFASPKEQNKKSRSNGNNEYHTLPSITMEQREHLVSRHGLSEEFKKRAEIPNIHFGEDQKTLSSNIAIGMEVEDTDFPEEELEGEQEQEEEENEEEYFGLSAVEQERGEEIAGENAVERANPPFMDLTARQLDSHVEQKRWKLPIGKANFSVIRTEQSDNKRCWFADKTPFIEEIIENDDEADVILITRPRRFGKTLNLSMLESFFDIKNDLQRRQELFDGLAISRNQALMQENTQHPVIFLTLKNINDVSQGAEGLIGQFKEMMRDMYRKHRYLLSEKREGKALFSDEVELYNSVLRGTIDRNSLNLSLSRLIEFLYRNHGDRQVVILIDEYDTPILSAFNSFEEEEYKTFQRFYRNFLGNALKDNEERVYKSVITGILHIAGAGIFSGVNNFMSYNVFDTRYSSYFGFTETDMEQFYSDFATQEHDKEKMREWYNGYRFGSGEIIYNPWSVLSCAGRKEFACHWAHTSSGEEIKQILMDASPVISHGLTALMRGESFQATLPKKLDLMKTTKGTGKYFWTLLLSSGYLRIDQIVKDRREKIVAKLQIPNQEIFWIYESVFSDWLEEIVGSEERFNSLIKYIRRGEIGSFCESLKQYLEGSPSLFDIRRKTPESFYHAFMLGLIEPLRDLYRIRSNRESGLGRYDVLLEPLNPKNPSVIGIVIEFKRVSPSSPRRLVSYLERGAKEAVQQIKEKQYLEELKSRGVHRSAIIGIAFHRHMIATKHVGPCLTQELSYQTSDEETQDRPSHGKRKRKTSPHSKKQSRTEPERSLSSEGESSFSSDKQNSSYEWSDLSSDDRSSQSGWNNEGSAEHTRKKKRKRKGIFNGRKYIFEEFPITGEGAGGNCGFTALGPDRDRAILGLLEQANDPNIRQIVGFEIRETFREQTLPLNLQSEEINQFYVEYSLIDTQFSELASRIKETILNNHPELESEISPLSPEELLAWMGDHRETCNETYDVLNNFRLHSLFPIEETLRTWSENKEIFKGFVESYLNYYGRQWLTFLPNNHGEARGLLDAIVITQGMLGICVWTTDKEGNMRENPSHYYGEREQATHILHTNNRTHFNLLLPTTPSIKPSIKQAIDEEEETGCTKEYRDNSSLLVKRGWFSDQSDHAKRQETTFELIAETDAIEGEDDAQCEEEEKAAQFQG